MSIAIHSSKHAGHVAEASAVSRRRDSEADAASTTDRSAETKAPKGRHALMNALSEALASLGSATTSTASGTNATEDAAAPAATTREQKEALHAFSHELFNALRPTSDGLGKGHHGRGFAWGRTSLGDLAERLEALAQKLGGATPAPAGTTTSTPNPVDASTEPGTTGSTSTTTTGTATTGTATTGTTTPGTATAGTAATGTASANTAATGTAASRTASTSAAATTTPTVAPSATVPTPVVTTAPVAAPAESPLLAAFRQLTSALKGSTTSGATDTSPADALAALLHKMSQALMSDGHVEAPASGSLIDVTA